MSQPNYIKSLFDMLPSEVQEFAIALGTYFFSKTDREIAARNPPNEQKKQ